MNQKIAIVGSGISGLVCGHLLHKHQDITLYEANDYVGGHTHTVDVQVNGQSYAIDTGFIVFNDWTYPLFLQLMDKLCVPRQPTEMSFSVKNLEENLEYNGNTINSLFAQRRNLLRPRFYLLIRDILRFNRLCKARLSESDGLSHQTLGSFLTLNGFSDFFCRNYILSMCAAIWSASLDDAKAFPLKFFLQFFNNHGLLNIQHRPQWYTLIGGSRAYIAPMTAGFTDKILLNSPVLAIDKGPAGYQVRAKNQPDRQFDQVILACHSDQALRMLSAPSKAQRDILGAIRYANNEVVLHTDTSLLPKRPLARASWNYLLKGQPGERSLPASVTYNMNTLQRIQSDTTFCVTLNNSADIDPDSILQRFDYAHPQFDEKSLLAQQRRHEICAQDGLHFCGAYWYNGFHEDGVRSALDVCRRFGAGL
ncbi:NAD(P)/FAD-dependent oxidoreductase [Bowmanella dokdonensis]|uniref:FAD-dependent oxidoreductase n=1 Tax=Bowmanella dokdonensis TaxID=751969 RepID=A0A939DSI6_9ALTE|nr:FAD-dependent oxidoreductase [Bowmanella dokdonensis]MBN7827111.1 FAD-dependent oxidoreductase [Bowmanella dokdonensis]